MRRISVRCAAALLLLRAAARAAPAAHGGGAVCASSYDCWLNGECIAGACVCDAAWSGAACDVLSELPAVQLWPPPDPLPSNLSALPSSWGSSIVQEEAGGLYHAFIEVVCREFTWMHIAGSVVVHATAPALAGPWSFSDVALPQQSMTPHIVRDTDGAWLLLHQRNASVRGDPECTGDYSAAGLAAAAAAAAARRRRGGTPPNATEFDGPPSIARATSLYGPWTPFDFNITPPLNRTIDNPNPSLLPLAAGAGYLLAFTSRTIPPAPYGEAVSLAHAADWRSGVFTPIAGSGAPELLDCEDPHLYSTARGLHVVCHRRAPEANPWNYSEVGGYGVSVDGGASWRWNPAPIYTTTIPWAGSGGAPLPFGRRERPEVILGADGRPAFLTNGVEYVTGVLGNPSLSVLTPLGPPPAGPPPRRYAVQVGGRAPAPVLSRGLPAGGGHSPCNLTFNPAFLPARPSALNRSLVIVRVSGCPPEYGGAEDHLAAAYCREDGSACDDLLPAAQWSFPYERLAEDPRVYYDERDSRYYLFYYANGTNQSTVYLRRSATPLAAGSWELVAAALPWHRNGCAFVAADGRTMVLWGETYGGAYPGHYVAGIGLSTTADWRSYTTLNASLLEPNSFGPQPEVCLEAATPPVRLSSGDWLHLFAAGTQGWGPWGPGALSGSYVAGWVVLDGADPARIVQRSVLHPFEPSADYERGSSADWPVYRNNTLFVTSLVPVPGLPDTFRAWYGAADANVATALVTVTRLS